MTEESNQQPIPGYRILQQIGEGGFAKVYLAQHEMLGENVALKIMYPKLARDVANCERFIREARTLAKLRNHDSIVTVHDIAKSGKFYYMAMEYLGGNTLREVLNAGDLQQPVIEVLRSLASALAYAHEAGIVHRDIKPSNIVFSDAGKPVLTDFGIAKRSDKTDLTLTQANVVVGTMEYMAPEQFFGSELDARSDLYALGVVLVEMLTGKHPFKTQDSDFSQILAQRLKSDTLKLEQKHEKWQPVVDRLLTRNPDDRYANAEQLLSHLNELFPSQKTLDNAEAPKHANRGLVLSVGAIALCGALYVAYKQFPLGGDVCELPYKSQQLSSEENATVNLLLKMAQSHEAVGRVTMPAGANAKEAYEVVLGYDPGNQCAQASLERIGNP